MPRSSVGRPAPPQSASPPKQGVRPAHRRGQNDIPVERQEKNPNVKDDLVSVEHGGTSIPTFFADAASAYVQLQQRYEAKVAEFEALQSEVLIFQSEWWSHLLEQLHSPRSTNRNAQIDLKKIDLSALKMALETQFNALKSTASQKDKWEAECLRALQDKAVLEENVSSAEAQRSLREAQMKDLEEKVAALERNQNADSQNMAQLIDENDVIRKEAETYHKEIAEIAQALLIVDQRAEYYKRKMHRLKLKQREPERSTLSSLQQGGLAEGTPPSQPSGLPTVQTSRKVDMRQYLRLERILPKQILLDAGRVS